ncbi:MAG TPA: PQQ-binding-like beta-propeller repeat protein [Vicinamibacterales bacterium]|nr:PQQ-binding-like beta-propeller repeat protein [Vicinamibacterales bacterium]
MRRALAACAGIMFSAAVAAAQDTGQALFEQRCSSCHVNPAPGTRAPTLEQLRASAPESILSAITTGSMAQMAAGLSPAQLRLVAEHASGKPLGTAPAGDAAAMPNRCAAKPLGDPLAGSTWNGWGADLANTRFQPAGAAALTPGNVPKLTLKWAFGFPNGRQAWGQPTVAGGRIFVGSDNGYVYSLDAATGCVYWSFQARGGVRTAITVAPIKSGDARYAVFFGDIRANVYAIDAATGKQLWTDKTDPHQVARITGAPAYHDGRLYVPVSSVEEAVGGNPKYPCCTFRGSLIAYDANTGARQWQSYTISEAAVPLRTTSIGTQLHGPAGAAVWAAPTIDPERRRVYISTSNGYTFPAANTTNSVMALDLQSGKRIWVRQLTPNDAFLMNCGPKSTSETCPQEIGPDFAVGTSPILKTLPGGRRILVVGQKSGLAWGIDAETGVVMWQHRVGQGTPLGGIEWGGAADDQHVYYPNADGLLGMKAAGGLAAIKLATGERTWWAPPIATCQDAGFKCIPAQSAAATAIPGVVFSGATDGMMRAYSATDGKVIWEFATARDFETVNGVPARGGSINGPGPTVVNGMVYFNSGYGAFGQLAGNVLLAFGVQ